MTVSVALTGIGAILLFLEAVNAHPFPAFSPDAVLVVAALCVLKGLELSERGRTE